LAGKGNVARLNFTSAVTACKKLYKNAILVTIDSPDEEYFITELMNKQGYLAMIWTGHVANYSNSNRAQGFEFQRNIEWKKHSQNTLVDDEPVGTLASTLLSYDHLRHYSDYPENLGRICSAIFPSTASAIADCNSGKAFVCKKFLGNN
jgi:hypothetical protein